MKRIFLAVLLSAAIVGCNKDNIPALKPLPDKEEEKPGKDPDAPAYHKCSDPTIPNDMIFSTTLGRNTNNVAQGFDYDEAEDVIYITQKYGTYRNLVGWQKRETASRETVAPNCMTLSCFSHGNNEGTCPEARCYTPRLRRVQGRRRC